MNICAFQSTLQIIQSFGLFRITERAIYFHFIVRTYSNKNNTFDIDTYTVRWIFKAIIKSCLLFPLLYVKWLTSLKKRKCLWEYDLNPTTGQMRMKIQNRSFVFLSNWIKYKNQYSRLLSPYDVWNQLQNWILFFK